MEEEPPRPQARVQQQTRAAPPRGTQARDSAVLAEYAALVEDTHALKELLRSYNIGRGEEVSRPGHLEDVARHVGLQMPKKAD